MAAQDETAVSAPRMPSTEVLADVAGIRQHPHAQLGLEGPAGLPLVRDAIQDAGRPASLVEGVAGANLVRFLQANLV